jgi:putative ABC transport system permease protein
MKYLILILKNLRRNVLRSTLTALGTMVLVFVVTLVWSVLNFLQLATEEKSQNLKAIVTERWSMPSRLPFSYATSLSEGAAVKPDDVRPLDSMTWQFYGGTLDPEKFTRENVIFGIAVEPSKITTMLDGLENLSSTDQALVDASVQKLSENRQGVILGKNQLIAINKRVGDRFSMFGISNFRGLDLEFEIVGTFPTGRYDSLAAFNRDYYNNELDSYERRTGRKHPLADRPMNLVWLKVSNTEDFTRLAAQIESSPLFSNPAVKCETASSGIASFLDAFRDLIWGMRWLLAPACILTLSMLMANAIGISMRERRMEMAILKVIGFRPYQILLLVMIESLLLGTLAGLLSAVLTYTIVNWGFGGLKFPIAFFDVFLIPADSLWWGVSIGALAALVGSLVPAWSACRVKVVDVFSKVA